MATIHRTIRDDGICLLTLDRAGSSANIFDRATLDELREELDFIEPRAGTLKGVIFTSAKRSIFIAGLDLKTIGEKASAAEIREIIELGQAQFNRISMLRIPTVAAIHGAAVGGGFEIALACDWRIASPDRATKIGLPETKIGLLPAWGGLTRLPRLIGLPKALDVILEGKTPAARGALRLGMIDDIVPAENLVAFAVKKIQKGKPERTGHWVVNNPVAAKLIAKKLRPELLRKTRGHYPAVVKAMEVAVRGVSESVSGSLELERDAILELAQGDACRNLIRIFFLQERAKKLPAAADSKPVSHAAVIGAGVMGAGIAQWLSSRGLPVLLRDVNAEQVARGMSSIAKIYNDGVKRHVLNRQEARDGIDRVFPAPNEAPLRQVDLVIEAAVENLELKKTIFQRLDALAGDETILATNTSALPISDLAGGTRTPERILGLHFFNPVHRMQLVEVVNAQQTAPEVLGRAVKFVRQIGKLPVVVKDSPGFLVNRILMPYLIEAGNLFENGARIEDIDDAMLDFGMPMGPLRLIDEVGVDVSLHVARTLTAHFGNRMKIPALLTRMMDAKMLGRKSGTGFYAHEKKDARPNPGVMPFVLGQSAAGFSKDELRERMAFLMVNESARCLEEQIVAAPEDVDFAMITGTGFAPFRGGPLRYADSLGAETLVGAMNNLVDRGAEYFAPCDLLKQMAGTNKKFYGN
ncbi:MAG TPA: 3-hydroxyacyl-CoA dehydrogenase NAD-binding domain-containing protein [Candidatus Sulfotelmatobacter sp.]|nr:3-hydroxyacyl-CoA dehydrogenase NAD-binding domain-containing protein [Candidatus Sulfotelmatobacter sp.]